MKTASEIIAYGVAFVVLVFGAAILVEFFGRLLEVLKRWPSWLIFSVFVVFAWVVGLAVANKGEA